MNLSLKQYWNLLAKHLRPLWPKVSLLSILVLAGVSLQVVNPQIIRLFIDTITGGSNSARLLSVTMSLPLLALCFLGVSLLTQLIGVAANYIGEDVGWRATNQLRVDLAQHCLQLDMSFHNTYTPGEMIQRIDGDVEVMSNFFSQFAIRILSNLLLVVVILVVLAYVDWRVGVALVAYVAIALIGIWYLRHTAVPHWKAYRQADADLFGYLEEQISGREDIRSSGSTAYVMHNLFKFSRTRIAKRVNSATMSALLPMVWAVAYTLGQIVAFVSSYTLFRSGAITVGTVFLIVYYSHLIFQPLNEIADQFQSFQAAAASAMRIATLYAIPYEIFQVPAPSRLPAGPLEVVFSDVTFGYNEMEHVLQDVSFHLQPGKVLGLLGRTGSGKTTLTRLLFRLYDPVQGAIHLGVDGQRLDIREISLDNLRQRVGLVTQNVQLFHATVRDNLTFFNRNISDGKILEIIEKLELLDWYATLPEGLDTMVGSGGSSLSAGEAQLLAFARIFLRDPGLMILDEASSRLDPATERFIERTVHKLLRDRTGIIIAHRLSTVHRADQIMIMDAGRIQEFGNYHDLAHDPKSCFCRLLQTGMEEVLA